MNVSEANISLAKIKERQVKDILWLIHGCLGDGIPVRIVVSSAVGHHMASEFWDWFETQFMTFADTPPLQAGWERLMGVHAQVWDGNVPIGLGALVIDLDDLA